ncbi:TspO/MBR family-domain-containing protein [Biscogniauxia marginata]|nr:TspO/MBR family-domain-containing protein [Biscogniauxia marginata]
MTTFIPHLSSLSHDIFASPAASVLLPIALGTAVGYSTRPKQTQQTYLAIKQPPLRPPPSVFGPVWTVLYGLTGYAAHRAVTSSSSTSPSGLIKTLYAAQLGLNLAWMPLFFKLRRPALALADVVSLLGANAYLAYLYFRVDAVAGWCALPYLAWLSFAAYLNTGVGHLNGWDISESTLATRKALGKDE